MAADLPGAVVVVDHGVEDGRPVIGPDDIAARVLHRAVDDFPRRDVAHEDPVALRAVHVGGVGEAAVVGAVPAGGDAEIALAFRLPVAVEQHLLGAFAVPRRAAMDRMLAALHMSDVVEPAPVRRRDGAVVLLDAPAHLVIERGAKIGVRSQKGVLVFVLDLQIGADFRFENGRVAHHALPVGVLEPGVLVPPGNAVQGGRDGFPGGNGGLSVGHAVRFSSSRRTFVDQTPHGAHPAADTSALDRGTRGDNLRHAAERGRGQPMTRDDAPAPRRRSVPVTVGGVPMGGDHPIVVQSMTNTDTADVDGTVAQVAALARAGSEIVRVTVDRAEAAAAVPRIREALDRLGVDVPLVGDFHYIGHKLLTDYPACAEALAKYRINPGNVGFRAKRDTQFATMIEVALKYDRPVRIGVNWGSLDQELLAELMDANARRAEPEDAAGVTREALVASAIGSAERARELGLGADKIVLSCKVSAVQDLIAVYRELARQCDYALHLGLTEAGMGSKGIVASTAALAVLLQEGIGDTIRISLTPEPGGDRTREVVVAQEILQTMGLRAFVPLVAACPGCGRTTSTVFQELAEEIQGYVRGRMPEWSKSYVGVETMNVAVMGCIVNGPGESKHANIGISLPGTGEEPAAPVFIDGRKAVTLRGKGIAREFQRLVDEYVESHYARR